MHHPHHEQLVNHDVFMRLLTMRDPFQHPVVWGMEELPRTATSSSTMTTIPHSAVRLWGDDELDDLEDELENEELDDEEEDMFLEPDDDDGLHARFTELERRSRDVVQRIEALAAELERQARLGQQD